MIRFRTATVVLITALLATAAAHAKGKRKPNIYDRIISSTIGQASIKHAKKIGIPPEVALGFCMQESRCGIKSKAEGGACWRCSLGNCGCYQVNFSTWRKDREFKSRIRTREDLFGLNGVILGVEIAKRYYTKYHKQKKIRYWQGHYKNGGILHPDGIEYAKSVQQHTERFRRALRLTQVKQSQQQRTGGNHALESYAGERRPESWIAAGL